VKISPLKTPFPPQKIEKLEELESKSGRNYPINPPDLETTS